MNRDETYMQRCLQLAKLGNGSVAPNPLVGAVLVHHDRIIGEGWHRKFGEPHAEVNCLADVADEDRHLISESTLYVSLEPCAHFGKTPPCADRIISEGIRKVVIGCRDPFVEVNGKGIERLQAAGVEVVLGVLEKECQEINKSFFTFHTLHRPYIVLKWAQSLDGKIASAGTERLLVSNGFSNRVVHKWRSGAAAILVGTNTALNDNPELTTRLWPGANPLRLMIDMDMKLPRDLRLFNNSAPTIVFNLHQHTLPEKITCRQLEHQVYYYQAGEDASIIQQVLNGLYQLSVQSVLVEGGARLLQSFIDEGMWDEARVITNENLLVGDGLTAPVLKDQQLTGSEKLGSDKINFYRSNNQP